MKIKENYVIQRIEDECIIIPVGEEADHLHGVIRLNETGAFLWELISSGVKGIDELENALVNEYNVDRITARKEIEEYILQLKDIGCIDE